MDAATKLRLPVARGRHVRRDANAIPPAWRDHGTHVLEGGRMAVNPFAQGSQAATVGTEHVLASVNAAGVYQGWVDLFPMQAGDVVELRVYRMVKSGGVSRGHQ